jgi:hypothetical protein
VQLTQFSKNRQGLCLQINSPRYLEGYIQMNKKQVQELVAVLRNWLAENELPSPVGDGISVFVAPNKCNCDDNLCPVHGGVFSTDY